MKNEYTLLKKIYQKIKWFGLDLCFSAGLQSVIFESKSGGRIIIYHGISKKVNKKLNARFISIEKFEKHLYYFNKYFHIVSLKDFFEKPFAEDKLTISITFDDGYRNNIKYALPLLKKYNIPATFFITAIRSTGMNYLWTDFLDLATLHYNQPITIDNEIFYKNSKNQYYSSLRKRTLKNICKTSGWDFKKKMMDSFPDKSFLEDPFLYDYWKLMNEQEIEELSQEKNVDIGAHGVYHNEIDKIPKQDSYKELKLGKEYLEKITKNNIDLFAYPDGTYSTETIKQVRDAGYKYQLASDYNKISDSSINDLRCRLTTNPFISELNMVYTIIKGRY